MMMIDRPSSKRANETTSSANRMGAKKESAVLISRIESLCYVVCKHIWIFACQCGCQPVFLRSHFPIEHFLTHKIHILEFAAHIHIMSFLIRPSIRSTQITFEKLFGFFFLFSTIYPGWKKKNFSFGIDFFCKMCGFNGKTGVWAQNFQKFSE